MNSQGTVKDTVMRFYITDLTDTVITNLQTTAPCQTLTGSDTVGYCNLFTYVMQGQGDFSCVSSVKHTVIEGIGLFSEHTSNHSNPPGMSFMTQFVYASKVGKNCDVIGSIPTGIQKYLQNKLSLIPNPTTGEFYLDLPTASTLRISSYEGKLLQTHELGAGHQKVNLHEQPGIYMVQLISNNTSTHQKLIIEK